MDELLHYMTISVGPTAVRILASKFLVIIEIVTLFSVTSCSVYNWLSDQPLQLLSTLSLELICEL